MRVVLADDAVLFRSGLAALLAEAGVEVVAQVGDAVELHNAVAEHQPDAAIIDIRMPPTYTTEGLVAAQRLRTTAPSCAALVLSQHVEAHHALGLLENAAGPGGVGYLLKERVARLDDLLEALRRVCAGGTAVDPELVTLLLRRRRSRDLVELLTDREHDTLRLIAEGRSNRAIAAHLDIAPKTVETYIAATFQKLQLDPDDDTSHRRVRAVLMFLRTTGLP